MNRDDILKNPRLIKRFCKDCNLPINVFVGPYFEQRISALDSMFGSIKKFEVFVDELKSFQNEQDYFAYYNEIKDRIITDIKNHPDFVNLNTSDWNPERYPYPTKNVYNMLLDGKRVVSIDMRKANFSVLHYHAPNVFKRSSTWEEYMMKYTGSEHIIQSKYIRQVIFGACNPKRQVAMEKALMNEVLGIILEKKSICEFEVYSLSNDEIILLPPDDMEDRDIITMIERIIASFFRKPDILKVSVMHLKKLSVTDGWFVKQVSSEGTKEIFKCLDAELYHQAVKTYNGVEITEDDLVFYHNGRLAKYLEPVFEGGI